MGRYYSRTYGRRLNDEKPLPPANPDVWRVSRTCMICNAPVRCYATETTPCCQRQDCHDALLVVLRARAAARDAAHEEWLRQQAEKPVRRCLRCGAQIHGEQFLWERSGYCSKDCDESAAHAVR